MKLKTIAAGALLAVASFAASAQTTSTPLKFVFTPSFNELLGTITLTGTSDIVGSVLAADSISFGTVAVALDHVTITNASVGSLIDLDGSAAGFSYKNVAAGTYNIFASGTIDFTNFPVTVPGSHGVAVLHADYNVTAVPEPETYGMLLGGLALLGVVARRKANKAA